MREIEVEIERVSEVFPYKVRKNVEEIFDDESIESYKTDNPAPPPPGSATTTPS